MFQSTHPHGVRHIRFLILFSYHLFQSTHPHGVRRFAPIRGRRGFRFQSTHPHGVRLAQSEFDLLRNSVSIHAPTRGATSKAQYANGTAWLFQSTHPHGVRLCFLSSGFQSDGFQSTHPHGVRLSSVYWQKTDSTSFNPRTHTGCDA